MSAGSHQASQIRPNLTAKFKELGLEAPHYPFDLGLTPSFSNSR